MNIVLYFAVLTELGRLLEIEPIIAERIPLVETQRAHELLGKSVMGKIVLLCNNQAE